MSLEEVLTLIRDDADCVGLRIVPPEMLRDLAAEIDRLRREVDEWRQAALNLAAAGTFGPKPRG